MDYRYKVKGVVQKPFILRGVHFANKIDFDMGITETELPFIKERCNILDIKDLSQKVVDPTPAPTPKPTPKPKQENIVKEAKANDGARKKTNRQVKV